MSTVAALFVAKNGCYFDLPDVDPWDEHRDARKYDGPHRVVAHPPCSRWCRLAGLVEARWGHRRGDDDGCFESALRSVRAFGGVLEHPAYSDAWAAFDLNIPPTGGGMGQRGFARRMDVLRRAVPLRARRKEGDVALRVQGAAAVAQMGASAGQREHRACLVVRQQGRKRRKAASRRAQGRNRDAAYLPRCASRHRSRRARE